MKENEGYLGGEKDVLEARAESQVKCRLKINHWRGAWVAWSVEHGTLGLGLVTLRPTFHVEIT